MISRSWDAAIARVAGGQDGVVFDEQLFELGLRRSEVDYRVRVGRLIPIHAGVYAVGHAALARPARLRAASYVGRDVALSHSSAGEWHGIVSPRSGRIHVTSPRLIRRPGLVGHRRELPGDEVETVDGVRVASVSRTLLDIAASEGAEALTRALRQAERRRLTDPVGLPALIARHRGARGTAVARAVLEAGAFRAMTESWLEDAFLPFLAARGLPAPVVNPTLEVGGRTYRPDCLWPDAGLIVELDGRADHLGPLSFESDRERDAELLAAGRRVMRITRRQLELDPDGVERRLRGALGLGAGGSPRNLHGPCADRINAAKPLS